MTDKTQLLPVTQADRELYLALGIFHTCEDEDKAVLEWGWADSSAEMQAIARYRISHSLPGDVGTETLAAAIARGLYGPDFDPFAEPEKWDFVEKVASDAFASHAGGENEHR